MTAIMTESEHPNHWKSLAEQIGAKPPERESQPSTRAESEPSPQPKSRKRSDRDTDPAPPSDWNGLAEELGIKADDKSEGQGPREGTSTEVMGEARSTGRPGVADDEFDEDTVAAAVTRVVEEIAEENIDFGDGGAEGDGNLAADVRDVDSQETDEDEPSTRHHRRRRRPRRRASRNRPSVNDRDDADDNGAEKAGPRDDDDAQEMSEEAIMGPPASDATEPDGDTDKPPRPSHRNIPTWEESIGVIVDANLEARSSRPKAARAGGSRGRGRSRSRGRKR